jgi:hypothetical protein
LLCNYKNIKQLNAFVVTPASEGRHEKLMTFFLVEFLNKNRIKHQSDLSISPCFQLRHDWSKLRPSSPPFPSLSLVRLSFVDVSMMLLSSSSDSVSTAKRILPIKMQTNNFSN